MKKRVLSAIIMILIFVPLLLIGDIFFAIFMTILSLIAMYELMNIREKEKKFQQQVHRKRSQRKKSSSINHNGALQSRLIALTWNPTILS